MPAFWRFSNLGKYSDSTENIDLVKRKDLFISQTQEKQPNYSSNKLYNIFSEEPSFVCVLKCLYLSEALWNKVLLLWLDISNASQIMDHHCLRWITFLGHPTYIGSLYLKQFKSCDVTRFILHTFCLTPTWRRRLPNTWVVLEKEGRSRLFF